jgi:adenylate cyclase
MHDPTSAEPKAEILIVDDNPANLTLLSNMLAEEGYEVRAALSGALALGAVVAAPPDIILLDINMPGMNGYDVCRRLKAEKKTAGIPIIFISALDAIGDKVAAFEMGGVDYVTKPFQMREVSARVGTQLIVQRQRRELDRQREELQDRYLQIQELQAVLKGQVSGRAWESIVSGAAPQSDAPPSRETLTLLAVDIDGFDRMAERTEPGPLFSELGRYMTMLTNIVYDFQGEVDKHLGAGTVAFFKDPVTALLAACTIQTRVAELNATLFASGGQAFPARIGLSTGPVVLGSIGSGNRREIILIGESVTTAALLRSEAPAGGILMDDATFAACQPEGAARSVLPLKRNAAPLPVHGLGAAEVQRIARPSASR